MVGILATVGVTGTQLVTVDAAAGVTATVPVYLVAQEGLTQDEARRLAGAFGITNGVLDNGGFEHVDAARYTAAPTRVVGQGEDEAGRPTVIEGLDPAALGGIKPVPDSEALRTGAELVRLAGLTAGLTARPVVSHNVLALAGKDGTLRSEHPLDTVVSYDLSLNGLPVAGLGARLRLTVGPDGAVTQLSHRLRKLARGTDVAIIGVDEATRACATLLGPNLRQNEPTLGYQFPELTARGSDGRGTVRTIYPAYTCNAVGAVDSVFQQVPAVAGSGPSGRLTVSLSQGVVTASAVATGGTAPYTFSWASSSTALTDGQSEGPQIRYTRSNRDTAGSTEQVVLQVSDANGLTATGTVELTGDGTGTAPTVPGGGGFGELTIPRIDAGTETPVTGGACGTASNKSANGFKSTLAAHGVVTQFDWRGNNAWESDFKDPSKGGHDSSYVDDVDIQWYSGHGSPNGFTFNGSHDDTWITPADARWGNRDLEWLQLESCNVLEDTNGSHNYFGRWDEVFVGLHLLNGFHTTATCLTKKGLGLDFAEYLFPKGARPALTVQKAWAAAAIKNEPAGRITRTMGPYRVSGGLFVWNYNDYFWGQGPVGPDITVPDGFWSISNIVT